MLNIYAFCVLLSAFLLFQLQPMIGKYILPWFGGTPTVWSTVLLFFQTLLTAGYAYAYWLLGRRRAKVQGLVHLSLLGLSLLLLAAAALTWPSPLTPGPGWRPQATEWPVWGIFRILAVSVAVPYLLLASNSTMMQAWFSRDYPGRTPYRLYALSNLGSLVGLLSYPFIFEPNLALFTQARLWSAGYLLFAALAGYLALRLHRQAPAVVVQPAAGNPEVAEPRPRARLHVLWIALAATASALLIAVTNQITQEVAVVPFLWVLPLSLYLLSFVLAFSGGAWYSRRAFTVAFLVTAAAGAWLLVQKAPIGLQIAIYCLLLFVSCMICHGELYRLRPHVRWLPSFYLMVAIGGAIGGIIVNLLAPLVFSTGFWELQWGVVAVGVLLAIILQSEHRPAGRPATGKRRRQEEGASRVRPAVAGLGAALLLLAGFFAVYMVTLNANVLLARRNFYGVLRVWHNEGFRPEVDTVSLTHGSTVHGFQFVNRDLRLLPTTFYAETSGIGLAFANHPARPGPLRVGALGLGIGVIAAYGQPGDVFRFYEINPGVIRIAEGEGGFFSFLPQAQASVDVVPGDARISLEREAAANGSQQFDLLVVDTFSGDAIPLHLLTSEAFETYLRHLSPKGILAVNVSNRYFNLPLEVYRLADHYGLAAAMIEDHGNGVQSLDSVWMLLSRDPNILTQPAIAGRTSPRPAIPANLRAWTDNYSNLLQVVKGP